APASRSAPAAACSPRLERVEPAHLGFDPVEPSLKVAPAGTPPQALGPNSERERGPPVNDGMRRLGLPEREPGCDQVGDAQHGGDRVPNGGLEGHGEVLSSLPI